MNHPNTRFKKTSGKNRSFWNTDLLLAIFLAVIGSAGLYQLFGTESCKKQIVNHKIEDHTKIAKKPTTPTPSPKILGELQISGYPEVGERLTFRFPDIQQQVQYELDFGDGAVKKFKNPYLRHTYRKSGTYEVKLWGSYNQQRKLIAEELVAIDEEIEVAPNAFVDLED